MNRIGLYLFRQMFLALAFVTLALTCAIWLSQSLRFIKLIVNRGIDVSALFELTLLLLPTLLLVILPIALFLGVIFTLNKLLADRELVVMQSVGISGLGLGRSALLLAGGVSIICYLLSLWLMPLSYREFKDMEVAIRNDLTGLLVQEGAFNNVRDSMTVYIRSREGRELLGILAQDSRNPAKPVTITAERGALVGSDEGPRVIMVNGSRQELDRASGRVSILYFDRYTFDLNVFGDQSGPRWREASERYLPELLWPDPNSPDDRNNFNKLRAEGHNRLALPLFPIAFVVVALACMLTGQFNRRGQFTRGLTAVVIVIVLQAGALGIGNVAAKVPAAIPLIYLNALLPVAIGLGVLVWPGIASRLNQRAWGAA